jgi:hypothetical protein
MFTRLSHNLATRRPWLLLWVLPYLLLTLASESLHNHGYGLGEQPKTPLALLAQSGAVCEPGSDQHQALSCSEDTAQSGTSHSSPHCLACQWSSQSVGVPSGTFVAESAFHRICLAPHEERSFVPSFPGITSTRGPPLS